MYDLFAKTSHLASRFLFIIRQMIEIWWLGYFDFHKKEKAREKSLAQFIALNVLIRLSSPSTISVFLSANLRTAFVFASLCATQPNV